jgi:hypothetical protein
MPEFRNCVKDKNGNIWCWDEDLKSYLEIHITKVRPHKVPEECLIEIAEKIVLTARRDEECS